MVEATTSVGKAFAALELAVAEKRVASIDDWRVARTPVHDAFGKFIGSARRDLDLSPVSATFFDHYPPPPEEG
ncbi:hypothetical protein [Nocardia sp. bgisy134]|uniref:hypothetical protein n=1 Tax=unclassified Nocardia TaxID=2637762 RepID=UPI003D715864